MRVLINWIKGDPLLVLIIAISLSLACYDHIAAHRGQKKCAVIGAEWSLEYGCVKVVPL